LDRPQTFGFLARIAHDRAGALQDWPRRDTNLQRRYLLITPSIGLSSTTPALSGHIRTQERLRHVEPTAAAAELSSASSETTMMIVSDGDIIAARRQGRTYVLQLGFSSPDATLVATAISELARNILMYAKEGEIVLKPLEHDGRLGVLIIARDEGPGMSEGQQAAIDAPACGSMMPGLRGMKRFVDELEIVSRAGYGTRVAVKKWRS
jgi:serine/threonine-protein kinase RsbT